MKWQVDKIVNLTEQQVDNLASLWNVKLIKSQNKMASEWNGKLTKKQVNQMASWQNGKLTKWQVDKMASWQKSKLTKWQVDKMTNWSNDIFTQRPCILFVCFCFSVFFPNNWFNNFSFIFWLILIFYLVLCALFSLKMMLKYYLRTILGR